MMDRRRSRGQALAEFAIVVPIIAMMIFGLLDLGRAVFTYNTITQAARQGARTAIVDQDVDRVRATTYAYAPSLNLGTSSVDVCFKTSDSTERDCNSSIGDCPSSSRVIGCLAIVATDVTYVPMTPIVGTLVGAIHLTSQSVLPIEYVCPYSGHTTCP
jgi:Flp pilus assembly protein TadG